MKCYVNPGPGEPVCQGTGRWHLAGRAMTDCERHNRYTMQARAIRADHAAQLAGPHLVVVADDLTELT